MKIKMRSLVCIFMVLVLFSGGAFAESDHLGQIVKAVEKTNERIEHEIQKAIYKVDKIIERDYGQLDAKSNEKIEKIINDLIEKTNKMASDIIEKAAKKDIVVECELIEVEIAGKIIYIDPVRLPNSFHGGYPIHK